MKRILVIFTLWVTAAVADPITSFPIAIPHGTNYSAWWTNSSASTTSNLTVREMAQTVNSNFAWTASRLTSISPTNVFILVSTNGVPETATSTTFGLGAGLVCADTNFVYLSVGTNLWKRAGVSGW